MEVVSETWRTSSFGIANTFQQVEL
jgi:hypothetical protein